MWLIRSENLSLRGCSFFSASVLGFDFPPIHPSSGLDQWILVSTTGLRFVLVASPEASEATAHGRRGLTCVYFLLGIGQEKVGGAVEAMRWGGMLRVWAREWGCRVSEWLRLRDAPQCFGSTQYCVVAKFRLSLCENAQLAISYSWYHPTSGEEELLHQVLLQSIGCQVLNNLHSSGKLLTYS